MTTKAFLRFLRILLVSILLEAPTGLANQSTDRSSGDLVKLLTLNPAGAEGSGSPTFSCGTLHEEETRDRSVADELAARGVPALPAVTAALDSLERGELSPNLGTGMLLYAFAKIDRVNSLPRLREMAENPRLMSLQVAISQSIALALGLTSYVSSSTRPSISICQTLGPRNVLDQFILGWARRDRPLLEESLGANARTELRSILRTARDINPGRGLISIGYRFEGDTRLESQWENREDQALETHFTNNSGEPCGLMQIQFVRNPGNLPVLGQMPFLIDNPDLRELLTTLARCAK